MLTHLQSAPAAPARVVILGANGFIPRALAARLTAEGISFAALSSSELDLAGPGAASALAARLRPDDAVVMAAAITRDKGRDPATFMTNLRMGEAVSAALAARPVAHFVYLSSDAVYDWHKPLVSEETPPSPNDLYSAMHMSREQLMTAVTAQAGIPSCILRPCGVYGIDDTHNGYGPNRFARSARAEGKIRLFGRGEETRDHVHIGDIAALITLTLLHRSTGRLNLVSGTSVTFADLAGRIARLCPRPVSIELQPRSGPITHRHFDATALLRSFPAHRPTDLAAGLPLLFTPA